MAALAQSLPSPFLNITIFLDPAATHFVAYSDLEGYLPGYLTDKMTFALNILQVRDQRNNTCSPLGCKLEGVCDKKAVIHNKMGASFTLPIPNRGLLIRNIIFDGIDSVIDYQNTTEDFACVNGSDRACCSVTAGGEGVSCQWYNDSSKLLKPLFNKQGVLL
ncbi:hypothetical protein FGO68_gene15240 [Halteria grandinella]|uniref:Uncharacterized protein n=1 Tax=Halteria grandinella TaxID=5974 RepID=A0A8J8P734_HALGN|nr:hypothetical protein FGO68_gene15240 [Halteria grandinella]